MTHPSAIKTFEAECQSLFSDLTILQNKLREKISSHADGKNLKGDEIVGWLGEVYGKLLFNGTLVDDREEHDFVFGASSRVSVKTRRGWKTGWQRTSAIPKIEGEDCPTHLLFVHLNDDYSVDRIWLFDWSYLVEKNRFKKHMVRNVHRSFIFLINENTDASHVVYPQGR
jgi:hypothetical protein